MPSFPIAKKVLRLAGKARRNWLLRHQTAFSYWIHMLGIPLALAGLIAFVFVDWPYALAAFLTGYLLQWIGHQYEGNDVGELIPFKKLLGLKTVSIAPQFQSPPPG
ncbi:hypothetical protein BH11PLA2_BH11PLA2_19150 [soil metagenome]